MRLAIISLLRTPYWEPLYRRLSEIPRWTVRVFHLQPWDSLRGWSGSPGSYDAVQLPCLTPEWLYSVPVVGLINPAAAGQVGRFQPECLLVHGYSSWTHWSVIRWAIRTGTPYLLWGDSNSHKLGARGLAPGLKRWWLRYFCRHAAGVLTVGSLNQVFWSHYGVERQRQFFAPLAVDLDRFAAAGSRWRALRQPERERLGLPDGRVILFAGRLVSEKNVDTLLRAWALRRRRGGGPAALAVAGDGPERARLERLARELGLEEVHWFGFQPQDEMSRFYAVSDALVLPSTHEQWGLVVNEAMATGLPVLLSRAVGCLPDLLEEGGNGFSFEARDPHSLAACLDRFLSLDDEQWLRMSARSREMISGWGYATTVAGIRRALESARPETRV